MAHPEIQTMPFHSKAAPSVTVVLEFTGTVEHSFAEDQIIESLAEKYLQNFFKNSVQEGGSFCE
ncbi:MAG: hypothetical protein HFG41_02445 [Coprococcus sp.]|nr:hypothetical protein [Coprococcus sp.]